MPSCHPNYYSLHPLLTQHATQYLCIAHSHFCKYLCGHAGGSCRSLGLTLLACPATEQAAEAAHALCSVAVGGRMGWCERRRSRVIRDGCGCTSTDCSSAGGLSIPLPHPPRDWAPSRSEPSSHAADLRDPAVGGAEGARRGGQADVSRAAAGGPQCPARPRHPAVFHVIGAMANDGAPPLRVWAAAAFAAFAAVQRAAAARPAPSLLLPAPGTSRTCCRTMPARPP